MNQSVPWAQLMAVALGSAVGGVLRWAVQLWLNARWAGFPLGTLVVNCVGGLLIGIALAWFARTPNESMRLLLVTGFLGGLTTFSAFTGESLTLLQRGDFGWAVAHSFAHLAGALLCCAMGFRLAKTLLA
ncbi:MAG: fluoride efflux transporter CrcB [Rhizobacter sp.]|jgi:CrcB protein|nr:fluoride efflux transporter CrcB [Rhizobacter sp.]